MSDRQRRSARQVVTDYMNELINRQGDPAVFEKLSAIETIASRMSWEDIMWRCRNSKKHLTQPRPTRPEPWWTK